jgi:very-short-patch-repair endonuclease
VADQTGVQSAKIGGGVTTGPEKRAWEALRRLRDDGVHVVRQHKIARYIVDFAVRKLPVAIEVDGGVHNFPGRPAYDATRQAHLESKGRRLVRIPGSATRDLKDIIDAVRANRKLTPRQIK